jgi:hypothetical protein
MRKMERKAMKKITKMKKLNLKVEILRTLRANELRHVEGGIDDSVLNHCPNQMTAASSGRVCCG